ncbi:MAG: Thermonuclease [Syntrophomonadaceae bacterium]|nr:Thermonuclease [Bacillota bacterium]
MFKHHKATSVQLLFFLTTIMFLFPAIIFAQPINATINSQPLNMEAPPIIHDRRTLIPLHAIFEALRATVRWDAKTRTVFVRTDGATPATPATPAITARQVLVTGVTDGDTIRVNIGGQSETVRLIGIDTPETRHPERGVEPFGHEAAAFTKKHLDGKTVWLEMDARERDRFGRLLAYVWTDKPTAINRDTIKSLVFNARLLSVGLAQIAMFPPNVRYVGHFTAMQREAQVAGNGMWRATADTPAQPGALRIVHFTETVSQGGQASVTVQGRPNTEYSITVTYKAGPSRASGLEAKTSGADGRVQWSWTVGRLTTPGSWPIDVRGGGESVRVHFAVR